MKKPTLRELEQRVVELEREVVRCKRAEERLRKKDKEWRALVKSAPDIILMVDRDGKILYINRAVAGFTVKEATGRPVYEYIPPENHKLTRKSIKEVFRTGNTATFETRAAGPKGSVSSYSTRLGPIKRGGKVVAVTQVSTDITDRKLAEAARRESEERERALLNACSESAFLIDKDGTILAMNQTAAQRFGKTVEELVQTNGYDLVPPDLAKSRRKLVNKVIRSGQPVRFEDTREDRIMDAMICPVFNERRKVVQLAVYSRDITNQRRVEEALQERKKEVEEVNRALRFLLTQRDTDQTEFEERIMLNVKELVVPYVEKLKKLGLDSQQTAYLNILESNLTDIISPFAHTLSSQYSSLTPTEIQTAQLIKEGRTSKEIAELLNVSARTIESHRQNIRVKMGLHTKKANLRSYLLSM
ncbi:MAG: PAS domain-containing protein [Deltaproteobacteria bacterium]|nr:PAS domain-containing protein [Deltaproteobacteria bacterium]